MAAGAREVLRQRVGRRSSSVAERRRLILTTGGELASGRPYVEKSERPPGLHDQIAEYLIATTIKPVRAMLRGPERTLGRIVEQAARHERKLRTSSDAELATLAHRMRALLRRDGFAIATVGE